MAKDSYVIKLLTLLVSRSENKIVRIPASELMAQDVGKGITVYWDEATKELVLAYLPKGATAYIISENQTWLANQLPQPQSNQPELPKSQDELIQRVWTDSAATQSNQELLNSHPPAKPRVIRVGDEEIVEAEVERKKRQLLREIESYQSPQPPITPSRKATTFFKQ